MPTPARQSIALSRRGREAARRRRTHDLKLESLEPRLALATGLLSTLVSVVRDDNSQSLLAAGATAKITEGQELGAYVRLTRRPDSAIVVSFQSRAPLEVGTADWYFPTGAAASNTLRFTRANWNTPQSVSFAALQDGVRDGDHLVPVRMTATIAAEPHKQATRRLMIKSLDSRVITPTKPVTDTYKGSIVGGENSGSVQSTYDSLLERGTVTLNVTMPQLDKVRDRAITVGYSVGLDSRVIIESLQGITASRFRWNVTYRQVSADRGLFGTFTVRQPILGKSATATMTAAAVALPPKPYVLTTHLDLVPKRGRLPSNAVVYGLLAPNHGTFQSGDHIHGAPGRLSTLKLLDKGNARTVRPFVKDVTRIEHTLLGHTVVDTLRYSGVGEELIVAGDAQKGHKLTLLNANSSTRFGIATSSPETLAVTLANAHEEVLRLRLDRAGGTADEATINYAGLVNDVASLDIVTSGKNHTDINATSNVRFVKVTGSGRNFLTFSDDGFGRQSIASSGLVIDGSTVTGDSTYFVGSYYSSDLILKGAEALGVRTYLGLRILGNQQLATLSNVQGLVIQKGSSGTLDMNSSKGIRFLELQTSATRPGELHAVATLIDNTALQSIQYVGGGDSGSQRFPGIRITGPASLPGPSDRLDINYTNRGTPLLPSSGVEMADPILLDGAEQVRLDLGDSIGQVGYLSLEEVGGEGMKSLTIVNPSHGFSDPAPLDQGGNLIEPGKFYPLDMFRDDMMVFVEGVEENVGLKTLAGVEREGKPEEYIRGTFIVKGQDVGSDQVKYLVANEDSFFYELNRNPTLRNALASRGVYTFADMPDFCLQPKSPLDLRGLGVPNESIMRLGEGSGIGGFKAMVYQDYITGDRQYVLAFAGTDDTFGQFLDWLLFGADGDWKTNFDQGLGRGTPPQYEAAMKNGDGLSKSDGIPASHLIVTGHSLGGGLATAAAMAGGFRADTFNAAWLRKETLLEPDGLGGTRERYPGSLVNFAGAAGKINAHYVDWDILTYFQTQFRQLDPTIAPVGLRHELDGPHDFNLTLADPIPLASLYYMSELHKNSSVLYGLLVTEDRLGHITIDLLGYVAYFSS